MFTGEAIEDSWRGGGGGSGTKRPSSEAVKLLLFCECITLKWRFFTPFLKKKYDIQQQIFNKKYVPILTNFYHRQCNITNAIWYFAKKRILGLISQGGWTVLKISPLSFVPGSLSNCDKRKREKWEMHQKLPFHNFWMAL